MAGDRYCPNPSAHEHRAAPQERPHNNHDGCNPYDPAHIAGKAPASQERPSIDVERLARAFDAHPGPVRASDNIAHDRGHHGEECWQQIAAEYARLSGPVGEPNP